MRPLRRFTCLSIFGNGDSERNLSLVGELDNLARVTNQSSACTSTRSMGPCLQVADSRHGSLASRSLRQPRSGVTAVGKLADSLPDQVSNPGAGQGGKTPVANGR